MENKQMKKSATTADMTQALKQLIKDNLVGLVAEEGETLRFALPNGQIFSIFVQETE